MFNNKYNFLKNRKKMKITIIKIQTLFRLININF